MKTKYKTGDVVFCKHKKTTGRVTQALCFFNEDNIILYKVSVDDKILLFLEDQLGTEGASNGFFKRLFQKCQNIRFLN